MKQRYFISILIAAILLLYSFDYFSLQATGLELIFFACWLLFVSFVIIGNIIGLLYKKNQSVSVRRSGQRSEEWRSKRQYGR
ncbi:hypothetical protein [Alkalihalobacillus sp. 1P02AB]|uniref:hypothetical protein n=1 Tax=Alkalihalobacillus sp. 1P02AB TaxID=3132260 RepID=UPI0039A4C076